MIKKVVNLPSDVDWNKVWYIRLGCCYCLALDTDLETYLEIEGHDHGCVDEYIKLLDLEGCIISNSAHEVFYTGKRVRRSRDGY